ncbi:hypothetical protein CABS01_16349 [Colletotrichum abscissum]|uniref:uncharacterized protein n=1 Tax=Colletotrichum abscissum TaxID=1671311 RepID=UPI0027D6AC2E|nr:uncharacterized protein CABS01_16349 [Colletotrichum abscissum]KAK1471640.1 hypothetical protein CABS01_16349 [Colletotrichum abscissum]
MGLRKPLVMAVAVGLQTKMWGRHGVRQCEGQRVIKSYSKASTTSFHSSHSRTSDCGRMYTARTTMGPACVGQVQKDEVCCQEEATCMIKYILYMFLHKGLENWCPPFHESGMYV